MPNPLAFLQRVISDKAAKGSIYANYMWIDNQVCARSESMMAGMSSGLLTPIRCMVDADTHDKIMQRLSVAPQIVFDGRQMLIRGGRIKAAIETTFDEPPMLPNLAGVAWRTAPVGLVSAVNGAQPFIGDVGYTMAIRILGNRVTAISPSHGIDIEVDGLNVDVPLLLTEACARFLISSFPLEQMAWTDTAVMFRWSDERWLHAQLLAAEMPPQIDHIFESANDDLMIEITQDYKDAFADAAALSEGHIILHTEGFSSGRGTGKVDVEFSTGLPAGHRSIWSSRILEPMMTTASHWCPTGYPRPCKFVGENLRGVIMGLQDA